MELHSVISFVLGSLKKALHVMCEIIHSIGVTAVSLFSGFYHSCENIL